MLLEEFLKPMNLTQRDLANAIHVPYQRVNDIVNERRGITPSTALRLARYLGTTPEYWMNLQFRWDLYWAERTEAKVIDKIRPVPPKRTVHLP
jgi:addiction module HigA family antidote